MMEKEAKFCTGFFAEAGMKSISKGYYGSAEQGGLACWIVAERVDAYEPKDSAKIAVDRIISMFNRNPSIARAKLREYLYDAHQKLINESKTEMLKASLIMVVTDYSKVVWAVVGNVRLYLFREGQFNFRSKDQTIAQVMVDSGLMDEDEVNGREERNNLINYLGGINEFNPLISEPFRLQDGDVMLLCNSGLWEKLKNRELADAVGQTKSPQEFLPKLKAIMLTKDSTRLKNYTVGAIFAKKVITDNRQKIIPENLKLSSDLITKFVSKITAKRFWLNRSTVKSSWRKFGSSNGQGLKGGTAKPVESAPVKQTPPDKTAGKINHRKAVVRSLSCFARSVTERLVSVNTAKTQPDITIFKTDCRQIITRIRQRISEWLPRWETLRSAKQIKVDVEFIKKIMVFCLLVLLVISFGWVTNRRVAATRSQNKQTTKYRIEQKTMIGHDQRGDRLAKQGRYQEATEAYRAALRTAKLIHDFRQTERIAHKAKTAQLMAAADKYIADGNFTAALQEYTKAASGVEASCFLKNELTTKISWAQQMIDLLSLDQAGDREAAGQNYTVARTLYQSAQMVALRISNHDFAAILTAKLNDVNRKIDRLAQSSDPKMQRIAKRRN